MASNPDHRSRKLPRRTSSLDPLKQLHLRNASTPSPVQTPQTLQEEPVFIHPKGSDGLPGEPVPPGTRLRTKSKTWGARVSSLLPPLISPNADPNPQPVTRKTVMAAPTSPPAQPSPPPPYDPRESPTNRLNKSPPRSVLPVEPRGHPSPPRAPQGLPPTQTTMSLPELDMGMLSLSTSVKPQIMAPIPPSPIAQDVRPEQAPAGLTDLQRGKSYAWVMSDEAAQAEYNPSFLKNGEKVPELWNESGAVLVFLYPRGSGCGPSFKVPEFTVSSSYVFNELMQSELGALGGGRSRGRSFGGRDSLSAQDATRLVSPPMSPSLSDSSNCMRLYLPAAPPSGSGHLSAPGEGSNAELDRLIAVRNLFAFLTGQPLVGTKTRPTIFQAFLEIADLLQEFGFAGVEGETFGDAVDLSFGFYSEQLGLADCRHSREKTLEALILGERMRCLDLYNEAFAHAAGKYSAIMDLRLPLWSQVTPLTRQQLERAHLDLVNRQHNVNEHLEQFEFPSLFAGIANSTSIPELKNVRFKVWRNSFNKMRSFLLSYYKSTFGSWPPKASSKKNPFAESGLNRLVLKVLYSDMCALYDLLVDRNNLTSRVMDEVPAISSEAGKMTTSALRNIMSEFDRSKPPVLPPMPFDLPQLPSMTAIHETFNSLSAKDQSRFEKKIKEHEMLLILNKAYNYDTNTIKLPFLDQFKDFEMRESRGKMCQDLVDQRIGYWIFLYVVLQSLPMLVVDAPDLKYTDGVEYFICEPPMGNPPWVEDRQVRKMWYEIAGGGGRLVELSTDAVLFSVEGTYHRSHCWLAAKQWEGVEGAQAPPPEPAMSPLEPPRPIFQGVEAAIPSPPPVSGTPGGPGTPSPPPGGPQPALRPRTLSPGMNRASSAWRSSIAMGLEPVPMEPPNVFGSRNRSSSLGPRQSNSHLGARSVSTGNLVGMARSATPSPQPAANTGATFDDILGEPQKQKSNKKKSRFF
ncbi:choriogenin hminor [Purpureocillium lilacinum]|uniref:Choriogenin hminor n=1 Tax=Purpureocillium lilacinum TaxID=33203 RepID=A0A179GWN8_PURLI|nr:choriogenin hminor [Purpureocillium lilacinum]